MPHNPARNFIKWEPKTISLLCRHLGDGDIKAGSKRLCRLLHSTYRTINKWLTGKVKHPGIASRYGLNMVAKRTRFKLLIEEVKGNDSEQQSTGEIPTIPSEPGT